MYVVFTLDLWSLQYNYNCKSSLQYCCICHCSCMDSKCIGL